jgi:thioredoxin-related protein
MKNTTMKPSNILAVLLLALLAISPTVHGADAPPAGQVPDSAAGLKWMEPFEVAKLEAKKTGKPMLVFVGNTDACKDCQAFTNSVCKQPEFVDYAVKNLICTRVLYQKGDTKDDGWKKSRIVEAFNIPSSHAVIITNADGKRIGELSTAPQSIAAFIQDIQTIIAKSVPEGRLKYSEVSMFDKTFVPGKTYKSAPPAFRVRSPSPHAAWYVYMSDADLSCLHGVLSGLRQ